MSTYYPDTKYYDKEGNEIETCEHDFQYIEKVKKFIPTSAIEYKYYYIFYCKKCCCIIHLESPI